MIQFLGSDMGLNPPADDSDATVIAALGVSMQRGEELAKAFAVARKNAYVQMPDPLPGLPPIPAFHLGRLMRIAELDADRPNELLLIGYLMGCAVTTIKYEDKVNEKCMAKMMQLMATNPTKAQKKILKQIKKRSKQNGQ